MIMLLEIMASVTFSRYWNIFNFTYTCSEGTLRKWQSSVEGRVRELLEYWCYHRCPFTHSVSTFQWVTRGLFQYLITVIRHLMLRSQSLKSCKIGCLKYGILVAGISAILFGLWHLSNSSRSWAPLRWHHNGRDCVSNHQPHHCLLNRLFGRRSKKTSKLHVAGLCVGNSPETGEFPAQMASNAENVSILMTSSWNLTTSILSKILWYDVLLPIN